MTWGQWNFSGAGVFVKGHLIATQAPTLTVGNSTGTTRLPRRETGTGERRGTGGRAKWCKQAVPPPRRPADPITCLFTELARQVGARHNWTQLRLEGVTDGAQASQGAGGFPKRVEGAGRSAGSRDGLYAALDLGTTSCRNADSLSQKGSPSFT